MQVSRFAPCVPLILLLALAAPAEAAYCAAEPVNFTVHAYGGHGYYVLVQPAWGGPAVYEESNGNPGLQRTGTDGVCIADTLVL